MHTLVLAMVAAAVASQPVDQPRLVALSSVDGAVLVSECRRHEGAVNDFCTGYILGAADQLQVQRRTCRPNSDAATIQTVEIVKRYIRDNPEVWGDHAASLVQVPLVRAFPCRNSN